MCAGPQNIKAEDTFLTGYVTFGAEAGNAEVDVVEAAQAYLKKMEDEGLLSRPAGVRYEFAGNYQAALESNKTPYVCGAALPGDYFHDPLPRQ